MGVEADPSDAGAGRPHRRTSWRGGISLLAVLVVAGLLVITLWQSGATSNGSAGHVRRVPLVPDKGAAVTVWTDQPVTSFNPNTPLGDTPVTTSVMAEVFPGVSRLDPQNNQVLDSSVVDSAELVSIKPQTVQYQIDPRAVWSDGVPISAADFIYAWQSERGGGFDVDGKPLRPATTLGYQDIVSVAGSPDGRTVTVVFNQPYVDWLSLFSELVPAHIAERVGWNTGFDTFDATVVLSGGPYEVQSSVPGEEVVLAPNPHWWGVPVSLGQIVVRVESAAGAAVSVLRQHSPAVIEPSSYGLDLVHQVSALPWERQYSSTSASFLQLVFNTTSPTTSQLPVRQAVVDTLDRTALAAAVNERILPPAAPPTKGTSATAPDGTTTTGSTAGSGQQGKIDLSGEAQVTGSNFFLPAEGQYDDPGAEALRPDPGTAEALLTAAGYQRSTAGVWEDADRRPLVLRLVAGGDPWAQVVTSVLQSQLKDGGFTVEVSPAGDDASVLAAGQFDLALVQRTVTPFTTETDGWYSALLGPPGQDGSTDWGNFDDPQVEQLLTEASEQLNLPQLWPIYDQVDQILWQQAVAIPLFTEPAYLVHDDRIQHVTTDTADAGMLWQASSWTLLEPASTTSSTVRSAAPS